MKKNTIRAAALALLTLAIAAPSAQAKVFQMPQSVCDGGDTLIAVLTWGGGIVAAAGLMMIGYNLVLSHKREDGSFTLSALGKWCIWFRHCAGEFFVLGVPGGDGRGGMHAILAV